MIGGEAAVVKHLNPIFAQLAPGAGDIPRTPGREAIGGTAERGYLHCGPNGVQSDALVFFGATGDLANKKIFPALHAMVKRGHLDVPVIGVAKAGWSLEQLRARAKDRLDKHGGLGFDLEPNYCRFRISPDITIAIGANVIARGEQETRSEIAEMLGTQLPCADEMDAYERVLGDATHGDATLFAREDYVEEAWRIVDPVLKDCTPVYEYEPGTWGPKEVDASVAPREGWQNPTVPRS
jgi:glucose-6-phosphate 1-dehydrogenase